MKAIRCKSLSEKSVFVVLLSWSLIMCPSLFGQGKESPNSPSDTVRIKGEYKLPGANQGIILTFTVEDHVLGRELEYHTSLDSSGHFEVNFPLRTTQAFYWSDHKDLFSQLIAAPGDSLGIIVGKEGISFQGRNAAACENIQYMWPKRMAAFPSAERQKALGLEPQEYLAYRTQLRNSQVEFLETQCKGRNCTDLFRRWYLADCDVSCFDDLLAFSFMSLKYGIGSAERLKGIKAYEYYSSFMKLPADRFEEERKLKAVSVATPQTDHLQGKIPLPVQLDLQDKSYMLSATYSSMLHNLSFQYIRLGLLNETYFRDKFRYLLGLRESMSPEEGILVEKISMTCKSENEIDSLDQKKYYGILQRFKDQVTTMLVKRYIDWNVSEIQKIEDDNIRELILSQEFANYIQSHADADADYYFGLISGLIKNKSYLQADAKDYKDVSNEGLHQLLAQMPDKVVIAKNNSEKTGDELLNEILWNNRNKVIFIDIWGTWCGPCRADMVKMAKIKESPPFDSVRFVYMCCLSRETEWVKTIKKYDIKGTHYFVTDMQYKDLQKKFKMNGFPTYLVIDKQRRLHKGISVSNQKMLTEQVNLFVNGH